MKKLHLLKTMLLLCALIVGSVNGWAADELHYTLDGTTTASGSNYDGSHEVTQNNMTWSVTGNVTQNPWRIGGKKLRSVDREVYSETAMGAAITKVELEVGSKTLSSVNSIKLIVASNSDFSTVLQTIVKTDISANSTLTFNPSGDNWATGAYYKFVFNVDAGSSNSYIQFKAAKFYKAGSTTPVINASDVEYDADETDGEIAYTITNPVDGKSLSATTSTDWITLGAVTSTKVPFTMSVNAGALREGTITLKYDGATDKVITVTQNAYVVKYDVNISAMTNGSVVADVARAEAGETVTLTITPSAGYKLATIAVTDTDEGNVALSGSGNTRTFTMPAKAVTVSAIFEKDYSITYDFSFASMGTDGWGGNYASHTQNFDGATVVFTSASKQAGTITDIPTTKGGSEKYVILTLTDANATLKSASFALRHWTNKAVTITMYYSTDGGDTWTTTGQSHAFTSSTNGENVTLTASSLPTGTNAIRLAGNADLQYGVASVTVEVGTKFNINSACTDGEGNYYGTYSNDLAFVVPEGLTVSEIKVEEGKLSLSNYATGETVPANTGVMVAATSAGDKTVKLTTGGTSKLGSNNMLKASGDAGITAANMTEEDTEFYRLTMHNGETIGFWWGAAGGGAFDIAANKAYLAVPSDAGARDFVWFDEGETTSLSEVRGLKSDVRGEYFNLNGQRVAQHTKGLYIVNGRKVVIK